MSNASLCREKAARYQKLAERAATAKERRACQALHRFWLEMAGPAERFDRGEEAARDRIYAMLDSAGGERPTA